MRRPRYRESYFLTCSNIEVGAGLRAGDVVVVSRRGASVQFEPRGVVACGDGVPPACDGVTASRLLPARGCALASGVPFRSEDWADALLVGAVSGAGGSTGSMGGTTDSKLSLRPGDAAWIGLASAPESARCAFSEGVPMRGACRNATTAPTTATGTSAPASHGHAAGFAKLIGLDRLGIGFFGESQSGGFGHG